MTSIAPVITVDGPSGSGKGTLCKVLAESLGWHLLDSGVIYRALALAALHHHIDITTEEIMSPLAAHLDVCFIAQNGRFLVILEGEDVSNEIRSETIGNTASRAAKLPRVREAVLYRQRTFRKNPGLITDGRDMGTIVFPDASLKIFLDANTESRTHRRKLQLQERGFNVSFKRLLAEMRERDSRDRNRAIAPLLPASDALIVDSSNLSIKEVVQIALRHIQKVITLPKK